MQRKYIRERFRSFETLFYHLDRVPYERGIKRLFSALPIPLQTELKKWPNSDHIPTLKITHG